MSCRWAIRSEKAIEDWSWDRPLADKCQVGTPQEDKFLEVPEGKRSMDSSANHIAELCKGWLDKRPVDSHLLRMCLLVLSLLVLNLLAQHLEVLLLQASCLVARHSYLWEKNWKRVSFHRDCRD